MLGHCKDEDGFIECLIFSNDWLVVFFGISTLVGYLISDPADTYTY